MWDMTHSYVWHDSITGPSSTHRGRRKCSWCGRLLETWHIHTCDVTYSHSHDWFIRVTWLTRRPLFRTEGGEIDAGVAVFFVSFHVIVSWTLLQVTAAHIATHTATHTATQHNTTHISWTRLQVIIYLKTTKPCIFWKEPCIISKESYICWKVSVSRIFTRHRQLNPSSGYHLSKRALYLLRRALYYLRRTLYLLKNPFFVLSHVIASWILHQVIIYRKEPCIFWREPYHLSKRVHHVIIYLKEPCTFQKSPVLSEKSSPRHHLSKRALYLPKEPYIFWKEFITSSSI